jgi:DNA-binding NarL/FixJ family response regulator
VDRVTDHFIYGLLDPRTDELRYIGKSDRPRERLANQLNERSNTHRCHWIAELQSLGLRPKQVILDSVPAGSGWEVVERAYIAGARIAGCRLTNGTDGGDGVTGLTGDSLARIRAAWVGRKHRPESIEKIRAASTGRTHTAEYRQMMHEVMSQREFTATHRQRIRVSTQKLTTGHVAEIRGLLASGTRQREIASRFGVHQGTISNIARGITYRDDH